MDIKVKRVKHPVFVDSICYAVLLDGVKIGEVVRTMHSPSRPLRPGSRLRRELMPRYMFRVDGRGLPLGRRRLFDRRHEAVEAVVAAWLLKQKETGETAFPLILAN